jgi:hypothetical protein
VWRCGSAAISHRVSSISEAQKWEEEEDDLRMGGQWQKTPRYAGRQGELVPRSHHGETKSVTPSATLAHPSLRFNTVNITFTLSCAESSILGNNSIQVCCGYVYHVKLDFLLRCFFYNFDALEDHPLHFHLALVWPLHQL